MAFNVPDCFSGDCDCAGTPPPSGFCPYGDCLSCVPSKCDGPKCCCCASVDVALTVRSRCYDRVFFSCNKDGTSAGPGEDPFPVLCTKCFDACERALGGQESCASISQHVNNSSWQPSPVDWWSFPPSIGPCSCDCVDYIDPNNPSAGCNLTCVTCSGLRCNAHVTVTSSNCNYQFYLTPGVGCCGNPEFIDIVFVIDYSGSMESYIENVINNVSLLASNLSLTGGLARFGLIVYGKTENNDITINHFPNGEILTTDVNDFISQLQLNLPTTGGNEPDFDAVETALSTYPWEGAENLIFLISDELVNADGKTPIQGSLGDPNGQPSAELLIDLANSLGVTVHTIQIFALGRGWDTHKTDLSLGTNGKDIDITTDFSQILDDINLIVFGGSCGCLDMTPIPVLLCKGGTGPTGDDCINPDSNIPIKKCFKEDNSDCACNEPLAFDVCGEIVIVEPQTDTMKLVCCGEIEGGGCDCPTETNPPEGCCGLSCSEINICSDFNNVEDAINTIWCECWQKAKDGEFVLETSSCNQCTIPDINDPNYKNLDIDAITNCVIKIPDGRGGFIAKSRSEIVTEVKIAWSMCSKGVVDEIPPPPISESVSCLPKCNITDECISGETNCSENEDIRDCRKVSCNNSNQGCISIKNPATVVLNNGIGLVAYESFSNISVIEIQQFNTSVPGKILPNRKTNYGRLQHESKWETGLAKLYYFENIASHFINISDILVFKTGPLQNQCFPIPQNSLGTDNIGNFIKFSVPSDFSLTSPFLSEDDVYNIEWFIIDSDDTGLTGSAIDNGLTPGSKFLSTPGSVNKILKLSPHIHDGSPVPVANPSISVAYNYMNYLENSHYVYLTYQALENQKWNLYLRQIRLSEYSKDQQLDTSNATFVSLSELNINELVYKIICSNDSCTQFGNNFLAKRTITMEVLLQDGREVFNNSLLDSNESWQICPGLPSGNLLKKKIFVELTHSVVINRCPTQFEFNEIFYNWEPGDDFYVPFINLTSESLFTLLKKSNDTAINLGNDTIQIGQLIITSSQVGAIWYEDPSLITWVTTNTSTLQELLKFKGLDISDPIPITDFENGHCTHPVISVDINNDIFVVYECTDPSIHQIKITGTSTPSSLLPVGILTPKNLDVNLDYFLSPKDFVYKTTIATEGINQLPTLFIDTNNVVHLSWQSNRDYFWEIYYANSKDGFNPTRITNSKSKSLKPNISGDDRGNLYIVWHDNRFGNWEILMAYRDDERILSLLEQDPYLASVRNIGYFHSSGVIPLKLNNNSLTEPLCISDTIVRFFKDRFLKDIAFDVIQSDFPTAFQIPNTQNDRTTISWEYTEINWELLSSNASYDQYGPILRSLDTELPGSEFDTVTLVFAVQPQFIRFLANSYFDENEELEALNTQNPNLTINDTNWIRDLNNENLWIRADTLISGQTYSVSQIIINDGSSIVLPKGRYKRVEVLLTSGDVFNFDSIGIVSVIKNRLCLAPQETITGYLDITPLVRTDAQGNVLTEMLLPLDIQKNAAYFISVLAKKDDGQLHAFEDQKRSISCESCVSNNFPWNSTSCSIKISFQNTNLEQKSKFYNARVRFYTDQTRQNLVDQFEAFKDGNLNYFTTDNNEPASNVWEDYGLEVFYNHTRTITLWPFLSNTTGLLCGITYWVEIEICSEVSGSVCSRTSLELQDFINWTCQCSSPRWTYENAPENIRNFIRWHSSGDGFSDTRLTETKINNFNPSVKIRSDLTGIVIYESNRGDSDEKYSLYASVFSSFPGYNMYASGAESIKSNPDTLLIRSDIPITACTGQNCDDTGPAIEGRNTAFSLDQYDNIFLAAEQLNNQLLCEEFKINQQHNIIVHRCGIQSKNLDFYPNKTIALTTIPCDAKEILNKTAPISQDVIFKKIIKNTRVANKFAKYHITRSKKPVAVVTQGMIEIEVISEPEAVAVRLRNEAQDWSTWFPFNPELGDYFIKIPWTLSKISGVKNVTIEAATYQGLSTSDVLTIIADYKTINHIISFYKSSDIKEEVPDQLSESFLLQLLNSEKDKVFKQNNILSQLQGIPVAGIRNPTVSNSKLIEATGEFIFINIVPDLEYLQSINITNATVDQISKLTPTFDVLQQGDDDLVALPTIYDGATSSFKGVFPIKHDNKISNRDGLSFIIIHFKNDLSDTFVSLAPFDYIKDIHNQISPSGLGDVILNPFDDSFSQERDNVGKIKHSITIRSNEDPYFVFGDPNYREKRD